MNLRKRFWVLFVVGTTGFSAIANNVQVQDLVLVEENQRFDNETSNDPPYSGPNDNYNAHNDYQASGPYNANAQYNAHNQYSANNQYSAHDQYNAHNQYNAHDQYNAHNQYSANNQYSKTSNNRGQADELRDTYSNYTFSWLMGENDSAELPLPETQEDSE